MLNEQDKIKELFAEKLGNFEAPVNPALWKGVASQIGAASAVTTSGITLITKVIIGAVACSAIGVASYFVFEDNGIENTPQKDLKLSEQTSPLSSETSKEKSKLESDTQLLKSRGLEENNEYSQLDIADQVIHDSEIDEPIDEPIVDRTPIKVNPPLLILPQNPGKMEPSKGNKTPSPSIDPQKITPAPSVQPDPSKVDYSASIDIVPNVFTPNGDRVNNEWFIEYTGELKDFSLVVLDKNSKTIYTSQDPNFKWNGMMMNGDMAPVGNYVYLITARDSKGNKINKADRLTIIIE